MRYFGWFLGLALLLTACQIKEEIQFNADGSGSYEMGFDMSEMIGMGGSATDSVPMMTEIDTVVNFATFLEEKKDSIATLPKAEQEELEVLRPLKFVMKMKEETKELDMRLIYAFDKIEDLANFAKAVNKANIKEMQSVMDPMAAMGAPPSSGNDSVPEEKGLTDFYSMAQSFHTSFNSAGFSRKVTEAARLELQQKKDTSMKADDPFVDMMRFKQVYRFPYRVKSVSNPNARIMPDFKGVELEANMFEANNDPDFFNLEVVFEQ